MFAMLLAAVTVSVEPSSAPQGAAYRTSAVSAGAMVMGRILEGVTIDYRAAAPAGAAGKRATSLLIDGQHVAAILIEFP